MDLSKLRTGELVAAVGGFLLILSLLFLNWYGVGGSVTTPFGEFNVGAEFGAWDGQGFFGTVANLVILAAGVVAIALGVTTATSRTVAMPVATSALTAGLGVAAVVLIVGRMLLQPGPNGIVDLKFGIFLALAGAIAMAWGGWRAMQDEGTTFSDKRERRPASPGATSAASPPSPPPPTGNDPLQPRAPVVRPPGAPPPGAPPPGAPPPGAPPPPAPPRGEPPEGQ